MYFLLSRCNMHNWWFLCRLPSGGKKYLKNTFYTSVTQYSIYVQQNIHFVVILKLLKTNHTSKTQLYLSIILLKVILRYLFYIICYTICYIILYPYLQNVDYLQLPHALYKTLYLGKFQIIYPGNTTLFFPI